MSGPAFMAGIGSALAVVLIITGIASVGSPDTEHPLRHNSIIPASEHCLPIGWHGRIVSIQDGVYDNPDKPTLPARNVTTLKLDVGQGRIVLCSFEYADAFRDTLTEGDLISPDYTGSRLL